MSLLYNITKWVYEKKDTFAVVFFKSKWERQSIIKERKYEY